MGFGLPLSAAISLRLFFITEQIFNAARRAMIGHGVGEFRVGTYHSIFAPGGSGCQSGLDG